MSNLVMHAQLEMEFAGLYDDDADYGGGAIAKCVLELINVISSQNHSGMSIGMTLGIFDKLVRFQPLTDLTNNPEEWNHIGNEDDGTPIYQNKRRGSTFSNDCGTTWYDIEDRTRDNGATWHGWERFANTEGETN